MYLRSALNSYLHVLTGSAGRVVLQAAYFWLLVNNLTLSDYGVFASALAASLILACGGAFGFTAPLFRAATLRRRILGWHLGNLYASVLAGLPVTLLLGSAAHALLFADYLSLHAFLAVLLSEALCWRLIDMLNSVNMGLGRYAVAALASLTGSLWRTAAALLFSLVGDRSLEHWVLYYFVANLCAAALCILLFSPATRLRWSRPLFLRRLPEAAAYAATNLIQSLQLEADKLLILFLTDQTSAGIYALSMRIIELTAVPVKSFFPVYVQMLMRRRAMLRDWRANLLVQTGVATVMVASFSAFVAVLSLRPTLLGHNIATASVWFSGLIVVAPAKLLIDYHREIFFAANRLSAFALLSAGLLLLKLPALALIVALAPAMADWLLPLDGLFLVLCALSAGVTWRLIFAAPAPEPGPVPVAAPQKTESCPRPEAAGVKVSETAT